MTNIFLQKIKQQLVVLLPYRKAKVYLKAVLLKVSSETSTKVYISKSTKVFILESIQKLSGCPQKVHKFETKTLCSENRSINKVSVIY